MLIAYRNNTKNMSEEIKLFKVTIDGQTTEVLPGTTIIEAARKNWWKIGTTSNVLL